MTAGDQERETGGETNIQKDVEYVSKQRLGSRGGGRSGAPGTSSAIESDRW